MKFSVIVTAYNVEKYLGKCLDSLRALAQENFEIILVDDGSTDSSLSMMENFAKALPKDVCKIISKTNGGLSSARNDGLDVMTGDYVIFIDGDDYINPEKLKELCQSMESGCDVTVCSPFVEYQTLHNLKDSDERYFSIPQEGTKPISELDLFAIPAVAWSKIYKTEIIKRIGLRFPEGLFYEDNYWHWMYMKEANSVFFSDTVFYNYVRRPGSIMSNTIAKQEGHSVQRVLVLDRILKDCKGLAPSERKRLIDDFLTGASYDCPKKEHFKLYFFMQELLKDIKDEELSPYFVDVKNGNFKIERDSEVEKAPAPVRANQISLTEHFKQSIKVKLYSFIGRR